MDEEMMLDAKTALAQGNLEESIRIFDKVLDNDPENRIALFSRGVAKFKNEDFDGAVEDCTSYIELNAFNEKVFCSRGNALLALGQDEQALADFNQSLEINPQYPTAYFSRSEIFRRAGDEENAMEDQATGERLQKQISQAYFETQGIMFQKI